MAAGVCCGPFLLVLPPIKAPTPTPKQQHTQIGIIIMRIQHTMKTATNPPMMAASSLITMIHRILQTIEVIYSCLREAISSAYLHVSRVLVGTG